MFHAYSMVSCSQDWNTQFADHLLGRLSIYLIYGGTSTDIPGYLGISQYILRHATLHFKSGWRSLDILIYLLIPLYIDILGSPRIYQYIVVYLSISDILYPGISQYIQFPRVFLFNHTLNLVLDQGLIAVPGYPRISKDILGYQRIYQYIQFP